MKILVTGAAGFIGFHLSKRLLEAGHEVVGFDNVNDYYDVNLKNARLEILAGYDKFEFVKASLEDRAAIEAVFDAHEFTKVVNLAAQAGVRYSIENPHAYINSNIVGFLNILEGCRHNKVSHLIYASSSSVYGANTTIPFSVHHNVDHPLSLYAASKKSNELMAHTYSSLYGLPTTGLRFFSVYGPWGRPDMALYLFAEKMVKGETIEIFNNGDMQRDFTYIDDIVENLFRLTELAPPTANENWSGAEPDPGTSYCPYKVYNIGNSAPVELMKFVELIEKNLGIVAKKKMMPMQKGDVKVNFADVSDLTKVTGYKPDTDIEYGVRKFVEWFKGYHKI
jgi:UDP-glucuronate 4-epimerase